MTLIKILLFLILAIELGRFIVEFIKMLNIGKIVQDFTEAAARLEDTSKTRVLPLFDRAVSDQAVTALANALAIVQRVETSQSVAADRVAQGLPAIPEEGKP